MRSYHERFALLASSGGKKLIKKVEQDDFDIAVILKANIFI